MSNGNTPRQSSFGGGTGSGGMDEGGMGRNGMSQDQGFSDTGSGMPSGSMGGMRNMASQAGEKLMDTAEQQKRAGADYMTGMAGAVRRAASEFEDQMPQAAEYIRHAADQIETMSDSLRRRDIGQMMSDVQSFARRQPTAFLGMSFLAGFAAVRFLRSSSSGMRSSGRQGGNRMWSGEEPTDSGRYGAPQADEFRGYPSSSGMSPGSGGSMNPSGSGM